VRNRARADVNNHVELRDGAEETVDFRDWRCVRSTSVTFEGGIPSRWVTDERKEGGPSWLMSPCNMTPKAPLPD
jgi:hypothetical protein